jgi:DNA-binding NarL/FixJ family response regulator
MNTVAGAGAPETLTLDLEPHCVVNAVRPAAGSNRITVLVVDDHPAVRYALEALVQGRSQFELMGSACTGEEAVDLSARLGPQVIVMDLSMPGLGGVEATRQVRAQQPPPTVVALSGSRELMTDALAAGASVAVLKEEDPQSLLDTIQAAVGT